MTYIKICFKAYIERHDKGCRKWFRLRLPHPDTDDDSPNSSIYPKKHSSKKIILYHNRIVAIDMMSNKAITIHPLLDGAGLGFCFSSSLYSSMTSCGCANSRNML